MESFTKFFPYSSIYVTLKNQGTIILTQNINLRNLHII